MVTEINTNLSDMKGGNPPEVCICVLLSSVEKEYRIGKSDLLLPVVF
jgi:hypothetical protein